eukprot:PhM_4_TR10026/c0_g1_i1/m.94837
MRDTMLAELSSLLENMHVTSGLKLGNVEHVLPPQHMSLLSPASAPQDPSCFKSPLAIALQPSDSDDDDATGFATPQLVDTATGVVLDVRTPSELAGVLGLLVAPTVAAFGPAHPHVAVALNNAAVAHHSATPSGHARNPSDLRALHIALQIVQLVDDGASVLPVAHNIVTLSEPGTEEHAAAVDVLQSCHGFAGSQWFRVSPEGLYLCGAQVASSSYFLNDFDGDHSSNQHHTPVDNTTPTTALHHPTTSEHTVQPVQRQLPPNQPAASYPMDSTLLAGILAPPPGHQQLALQAMHGGHHRTHTPSDLLNDLVRSAQNGTVHMQHTEGKSTLTMSHVGEVHRDLLAQRWPDLEKFIVEYARFAAYLRAQGDTTRERVSSAWMNPIHDIKVKQDALTGLLDAYYRKVFRSHQPIGKTQFDVVVPLPEVLVPSQQVLDDLDRAIRRRDELETQRDVLEDETSAILNHLRGNASDVPVLPAHETLRSMSRKATFEALREAEEYLEKLNGAQYQPPAHVLLAACAVCVAPKAAEMAARAKAAEAATGPAGAGGTPSNEEEYKARHKWFPEQGVHLKDMKCLKRLYHAEGQKVFLVSHPQCGLQVVKECGLGIHARDADRNVGQFCRLWEHIWAKDTLATYLCRPTDVFWRGTRLKIVSPYAQYGSMADVVSASADAQPVVLSGTPIPPRADGRVRDYASASTVGTAILEALRELHGAGIVHGNISLSNILVVAGTPSVAAQQPPSPDGAPSPSAANETTQAPATPVATTVDAATPSSLPAPPAFVPPRFVLSDLGSHVLRGDSGVRPADDIAAVGKVVACISFRQTDAARARDMTVALNGGILLDFVLKCESDAATIPELLAHPFLNTQHQPSS